jgi:tetratricopeptide (TPR) repeat protein
MAANHRLRGELFARTNRSGDAESAYRQELVIREDLADDFASWPQYRERAADSAWQLGRFLIKTNRAGEAEPLLQKALKAAEQAAADAPTQSNFRRRLADQYVAAGDLLHKAGRDSEAEAAYQRAMDTWEQLLVDFPEVPLHHRELARFLTQAPAIRLRNLERATELATQGVELAADDASSWYTLGLVHYAAGRWDAARVALEKCLKIQPKGSASAGFLLAMAHWQLGDKQAAQKWYAEAASWTETSDLTENLHRLRAEAEALLADDSASSIVAAGSDEPETK